MKFDTFIEHMKVVFKDNDIIMRGLEGLSENYVKLYCDSMNDFDKSILHKSDIHGLDHNIRVSIFTLIISSSEKIPIHEFNMLLDAAKYHDIGRINDYLDNDHGRRSSERLDFLNTKYNEEDLSYLKAIVEAHSIPDEKKDLMVEKYLLDDNERFYRLLNVLKDSDGLDRVRVGSLNPNYLRTEKAKELVDFAYELFDKYELLFDIKPVVQKGYVKAK